MPLSRNMLNFLGYALERPGELAGFVERDMAVGLGYPFGIKSMLKQGLIVEGDYQIPLPKEGERLLPGCPYGEISEGYRLTPLGAQVGYVGMRARAAGGGYNGPHWEAYVAEGQEVIDAAPYV